MKWTFRWFGPHDPVDLKYIRQLPGVADVTTSLHDVPEGVAWPQASIDARRRLLRDNGMTWSVVESIPVSEAIKTGQHERDAHIEAWLTTLERLAEIGVTTICYNFMPVFDWWRSVFDRPLRDGSNAMSYDQEDVDRFDIARGVEQRIAWARGYTEADIREALAPYENIDEAGLFEHLAFFIHAVTPTAERLGVRLALHPDDPPWSIFGLPRIVTNEESISRILSIVDSPAHGLTYCTGSLGANPNNDLAGMARGFAPRIAFVHARNLRFHGQRSFHEVAHHGTAGDIALIDVMRALVDKNVSVPLRPDHGRMIWGETGIPGYGLHDRALGLAYLQGMWEGLQPS